MTKIDNPPTSSIETVAISLSSEIYKIGHSHHASIIVTNLTNSRKRTLDRLTEAERSGLHNVLKIKAFGDDQQELKLIIDKTQELLKKYHAKINHSSGVVDNISDQPFGVDPALVLSYRWIATIDAMATQSSEDFSSPQQSVHQQL